MSCFVGHCIVLEDEVMIIFQMVSAHITEREYCLARLLVYFEDNYIGTIVRPVRFLISVRLQWERMLFHLNKTNNNIEGWHRGISSGMGVSNPTIWRFMEYFRRSMGLQHREIEQLNAGGLPTPRRRKWANINEHLHNITGRLYNMDMLEHLRRLLRTLCFKLNK